jgi:hypothetical protein
MCGLAGALHHLPRDRSPRVPSVRVRAAAHMKFNATPVVDVAQVANELPDCKLGIWHGLTHAVPNAAALGTAERVGHRALVETPVSPPTHRVSSSVTARLAQVAKFSSRFGWVFLSTC